MRGSICLIIILFFVVDLFSQTDTIASHRINEVEVTAKITPSVLQSTVPLQVVTSDDINRMGIQSLADAIGRLSGVVVKDYGGIGGLKTVSLRGSGAEHTTVLYDGIALGNAQSGQIDLSNYSLDNIELISLTIGQSDNIFRSAKAFSSVGILDIQTVRPDFSNKNYQGHFQVKTGSWEYIAPYLYYAHKLNEKYAISVDGNWIHSDGKYSYKRENGVETQKSKRKNSDVDMFRTELNLFGNLSDKQSLDLKLYYFDSERGLPGPITLYNDGSKQRQWNRDFFTQANYTNKFTEKFDLQVKGKYSYNYTKYINGDNHYADNRYKQNEWYLSGAALYTFSDRFSFSLAEDFLINTLPENRYLKGKPERYTSLTALSAKYDSQNITLIATVLTTLIGGDRNTQYAKKRLSPAFSVSYKPFDVTNLRIRASVKETFRVPTFNELYYKQMGNLSLESEKSMQTNLGLTWSSHFSDFFDYFRVSGDVYYNNVKDKLVTYISYPESRVLNAGKVYIKGVDMNVDSRFLIQNKINLQFSGSYTFQRAKDKSNKSDKHYNDQIPFTPEHSGSMSFTVENPWVNIGYSLIASSHTYDAPQNINLNKIAGYVEHSINANRAFTIGMCRMRIQGEITNLGGKTYYIIKEYPMPGRAFRLTLNIKF